MLSIFDIFKIGIGPSSSHTIGPMKAAKAFIDGLKKTGCLAKTSHVEVNVHGSLALTGRGHHTDQAIMLGLAGLSPETVDIKQIPDFLSAVEHSGLLPIVDEGHQLEFHAEMIRFIPRPLPLHENGMEFVACSEKDVLFKKIYYSIGGGFIVTEENFYDVSDASNTSLPYAFTSAEELVDWCEKKCFSISTLMLENEKVMTPMPDIAKKVEAIWQVMQEGIKRGCEASDVLPGPLQLARRAPRLYRHLMEQETNNDPMIMVDWVNLYALAVSEENAAGGRIVTSPTNGAAGIIPAVLSYYNQFIAPLDNASCMRFLMTSAAIGMLYKMNASISGAEVGCQGEIGVSCSMAAAGLAELLGATAVQVTEAAEIAMEHHLGLTCDPVGGQVQIPCIERNAMSSMKAINACRMAMQRETKSTVSLDKVIETMYETGKDLNAKYRETAQGGLAIKIAPVCT